MRNTKQDSAMALSRFGRDKRERTSATKVERNPRPRREADNEGYAARGGRNEFSGAKKRTSYNPNFSEDNRLKGRGERQYGERSYGERQSNDRNYGERSYGERNYGERSFSQERGQGASRQKPAQRGGSSEFRREGGFGGGKKFSSQKPSGQGGRKFAPRREQSERSYPRYNPSKQMGDMRLNRFLAQSGLCSRREADDFITAGLVTVNGVIVTELGTKVRPSDEVKFNDSKVQGEKKVYLVLNKPKGYVTSLEDPHNDKTVMELVKSACTERIYPVGRLDKNSLGLLLFTNDGDVTRLLTHPSQEKKKVYQVTLDKPLTRADMEQITEGITLEDGEIYADEIAYVGESKKEIGIEIHSGRNRIVRRIFEHLGYSVQKLDRVYYAGITKKNLKRGQWRFLTREEVDRLKSGRYE
ncbi:MAG: pseudouridine synthase [Alistipes sp.]|nr:pseudouridine synthase [Alistipes sp.]